MSNLKKALAIGFQLLIFFFSVTGIMINVAMTTNAAQSLQMLSYYTIQSNIIVALVMAADIILTVIQKNNLRAFVIIKGGATLWIMVTGVVYHVMLSGMWNPQGSMVYVNLSLHYITPIAMLLNWLIFEPKGQFRWRDSLWWLTYPLLYAAASLVRGQVDGFYPYWFLNPTASFPKGAGGWGNVLLLVLGLVIIFELIGLLIIWLDLRMKKKAA